jgi:hypothetical protein
MNPVPSTAIQDSSVRETQCAFCGASDSPMRGKDLRSHTGHTWRLASACIDSHACSKRARDRDAHMDQRYSLTEAGRVAALAFIEQAEQLSLGAA